MRGRAAAPTPVLLLLLWGRQHLTPHPPTFHECVSLFYTPSTIVQCKIAGCGSCDRSGLESCELCSQGYLDVDTGNCRPVGLILSEGNRLPVGGWVGG